MSNELPSHFTPFWWIMDITKEGSIRRIYMITMLVVVLLMASIILAFQVHSDLGSAHQERNLNHRVTCLLIHQQHFADPANLCIDVP